MMETIRNEIEYLYSAKAKEKLTVLYGGSVNLSNYKKILANDTVNGVLVGGACLDVENFAIMCKETY